MKTLKNIFAVLVLSSMIVACETDNINDEVGIDNIDTYGDEDEDQPASPGKTGESSVITIDQQDMQGADEIEDEDEPAKPGSETNEVEVFGTEDQDQPAVPSRRKFQIEDEDTPASPGNTINSFRSLTLEDEDTPASPTSPKK